MESILIIDDDVSLCSMLQDYFKLQKMSLAMCHDGIAGLELARRGQFDLVLLDLMLPGIDGLNVLVRLRSASDVGIVLLTSRGEVDDRILGLECGADDYLPKPFNPRELVARIRAILKRPKVHSPDLPSPAKSSLSVHGFALDTTARSAEYRGSTLPLTGTEFALLEAFLESPGVVLPREQLFCRISQRPFHPLDRSLDMQVSRLRRKLDIFDNPGAAIRTIRSAGYVFAIPGRDATLQHAFS